MNITHQKKKNDKNNFTWYRHLSPIPIHLNRLHQLFLYVSPEIDHIEIYVKLLFYQHRFYLKLLILFHI